MAIPENAIIVDESITTGRGFFPPTASAAPHDWLQNMGGSIGFSTPVATGAAVACPDRKVICMVGDGSAMYTIQSLWTQAREGLNVVTIVFANRIYQILRGEFDGVGAGEPGKRAQDMLKIDRPTIDFVALAKGMGVAGRAVDDRRRIQQGAGGSHRRAGPATDRSADVKASSSPTQIDRGHRRAASGEVRRMQDRGDQMHAELDKVVARARASSMRARPICSRRISASGR